MSRHRKGGLKLSREFAKGPVGEGGGGGMSQPWLKKEAEELPLGTRGVK